MSTDCLTPAMPDMPTFTPTLTPYDTGEVLQPIVWPIRDRDNEGDYGFVDFDDDEGASIATVRIVRDDSSNRRHTPPYAPYIVKISAEPTDVRVQVDGVEYVPAGEARA